MAPFLREGIAPREYQSAIAASALARGNTLVVLPTGLGKTLVAFLVMEERLKTGRVVFLAPTKPLVRQHHRTFLEMTGFPEGETALITGEIPPKGREAMWKRKACFSTPQTLQNDLKKGRADAGISLCVVDEAHRAVGSYAYTYVATECARAGALVLGLTASPGGNKARIQEIVGVLGIKNIEIRTAEDPDVLPYMMPLDVTYVYVPLGESFTAARLLLEEMLHEMADRLSAFGMHVPFRSKRALVELRARILRMGEKSRYTALSFYASVFNLSHMLELIETQGPAPFLSYVKKMEAREDTKARHRIFADRRFMEAVGICEAAEAHPKLEKLAELLSAPAAANEKTLVFAQYRDSVKAIGIPPRKGIFRRAVRGEEGRRHCRGAKKDDRAVCARGILGDGCHFHRRGRAGHSLGRHRGLLRAHPVRNPLHTAPRARGKASRRESGGAGGNRHARRGAFALVKEERGEHEKDSWKDEAAVCAFPAGCACLCRWGPGGIRLRKEKEAAERQG